MITLRPWNCNDVEFCLKVRNHPKLMKWFRQDRLLTANEQKNFIENDNVFGYNGKVIMYNATPIGLCGIKFSGEFTIGVLPEYQGKGLALKAMQALLKNRKGVWSEVFVGNPALEWFISKLGFKIIGVKERAYYKKEQGLVDVVLIKKE